MFTVEPPLREPETATFASFREERVPGGVVPDRQMGLFGQSEGEDLAEARLRAFAATLQLLPLAAALTNRLGEMLGANQKMLDILGLTSCSSCSTLRLPFPTDWVPAGAGRPQGVQAGRVWLARRDGLTELQVVVAGMGGNGCMLYLVTDANSRVAEAPLRADLTSRLASLTSRETQVLRLAIAGGTNKSVARELSISPRTVEVHRARVLRKLGVKSLSQAVAVAVAAGLEAGPGPGAVNNDRRTAADAWRRQSGSEASYSLRFQI